MGITNINGIAITASLASTATTALSASTGLVTTNAVHFPIFVDANNMSPASEKLGTVAGYNFNPGTTRLELTGSLFATTITGSITGSLTGSLLGTASRAVSSSDAIFSNSASKVNIEAIGTNALYYPTFVTTLGSPQFQQIYNDSGLTYNPSTNELRANLFNIQTSGSNSSTADANLTIDASLTQSMYWVASFTATRSLVVNNLTQGRQVRVYIRNTNATQRQIIFSGSTTTSGHGLTNMAVNAGAASVTTQNIVANNGTMLATMENMGGFIVGGLM
jgi:hypothetical protein